MKKKIGIVAISGLLIAGSVFVTGTHASPKHSYKVQKVDAFKSEGTLTKEMGQQIDSTGNLVTTYSGVGVHVVPFKDLTPAQIKILQEKGIKFPKALLEEKKKQQ